MYLRVKSTIFACVNVLSSCEITLDSLWGGDDGEEILYLLPSFKGEKGRRFYKFLHWSRSKIRDNFVVQTYANLHVSVMSRIAKYGAMEALRMKKRRKMKSWARWDKFAKLFNRRAQWGKNLITQFGSTVDLSDAESPEEALAAKEAQELKEKLEKEKQEAAKALARLKKQEAIKAANAAKKAKEAAKQAAKDAKKAMRGTHFFSRQ